MRILVAEDDTALASFVKKGLDNSRFDSNWELSTARATQLVRLLMLKYQFAPDRLSAAGYAAYHPVAPNHTAEGRAQNRRVDVVILGKLTSPG